MPKAGLKNVRQYLCEACYPRLLMSGFRGPVCPLKGEGEAMGIQLVVQTPKHKREPDKAEVGFVNLE